MTRPDMSPKAVTVRILRTSQLRELCIKLGQEQPPDPVSPAPDPVSPEEGSEEHD